MHLKGRQGLPVLLALAASLLSPSPVGAAPSDRAAALADYQRVRHDESVPAGWTGSVGSCTIGTEAPDSLQATLDAVDVMRSFAGLAPVTFDPQKDQRALAAALMMKAAGRLSHSPPPSWPCYSDEGAEGAGTSNLFLGESGAGAIVGYVGDEGVDSLGHRRWVLDPDAEVFGSGSTGSSNALTVVDNAGDGQRAAQVPPDNVVAWPPAGDVPWPWVFSQWSAAIGNDTSQTDVSLAQAQVAVSIDGQSVAVSGVRELPPYYGTGDTLSWAVDIPSAMRKAAHRIDVAITGVTLDGAALPITYTINAFNPSGNKPVSSDLHFLWAKVRGHRLKALWHLAYEAEGSFSVTLSHNGITRDYPTTVYKAYHRLLRARIRPGRYVLRAQFSGTGIWPSASSCEVLTVKKTHVRPRTWSRIPVRNCR
jgi:uncharacterized protein YkwD